MFFFPRKEKKSINLFSFSKVILSPFNWFSSIKKTIKNFSHKRKQEKVIILFCQAFFKQPNSINKCNIKSCYFFDRNVHDDKIQM